MSSIADMLAKEVDPKQCRFSKLMQTLDTIDLEDRDAIYIAMRSGLTPNKIAKAIRSGGHKISHSTIQEHKEKSCICEREFQWV